MAAVQLKDKAAFLGKTNEVIGWKVSCELNRGGALRQVCPAALTCPYPRAGAGLPAGGCTGVVQGERRAVTCGMAMPMFFRWLFLFELHKVSAGVHRVDPSA
jgi:hypothetical protein